MPALGHQVVELTTSRDGRWTVMRTGGTDTSRLILAQERGVDSVPRALASGPGTKLGLALSPDGRFVAFNSGISGRPEVYVTPFPDMAAARWQISLAGGMEPRWSADGKTLFYVNVADELVEAKLAVGSGVTVQATAKLLDLRGYERDGGFHQYEPDATGQRFLMLRREPFPGDLVVVENWFAEVRDKLKGTK
jgi:dipeptidyl aminopeptidase/acylaminoacyl peptidase